MRAVFVCVVFGAVGIAHPVVAQSQSQVDQLRAEITERNDRLAEIEKEIAAYQAELQKVGAEKNTLQSAINQLELERKKVNADISYTQNRIGATDLTLSQLEFEIADTERDITRNKSAISETLARLNAAEDDSLVVALLRHENLSEFWGTFEELEVVRSELGRKVVELSDMKRALEEHHGTQRVERERLVSLKTQYDDQQRVLANNKAEKDRLLEETKSEEAEYQKMLADRQAAREQLERELRDYESQLQFILDPTSIPSAGTAVFRWPLDSVRITQYFGNTAFAQSGAYNGSGHNGIDLGVPRGTRLLAPLAGTVRATGNTDAVSGCYSWGKWILVDHLNGLSTLYAHLDVISVSPGQSVKTGEIIGYTGNTGYSTGPHLHFTVYVKAAVEIRTFSEIKTSTACGAATTPVAAVNAYLNPMNYLPPVP